MKLLALNDKNGTRIEVKRYKVNNEVYILVRSKSKKK